MCKSIHYLFCLEIVWLFFYISVTNIETFSSLFYEVNFLIISAPSKGSHFGIVPIRIGMLALSYDQLHSFTLPV